jgi:hypothetical protein
MKLAEISVMRKDEKLFVLIMSAIKEPNFYKKLHLTYLLTFNITSDLAIKYNLKEFQDSIRELLLDQEFIRALLFRESMLVEDANIYFGMEHIDCPYNYNPELDKMIGEVDLNITEFLAGIVSELDIKQNVNLDEVHND